MLRRLASITPGIKRLPIFKLIAITEIAILAGNHLRRLDREERSRLFWLIRHPHSLDETQKAELRGLVAKLEPRLFAGMALDKVSPIPLPRFITGADRLPEEPAPRTPA